MSGHSEIGLLVTTGQTVVVEKRVQWGIIAAVGDERAVYEIPVDEEGALQAVDSAALHLQHGVAPRLLAGAFDIACGEVHTADEADDAVDDDNLPVVAVVGLRCESRELYRHEGVDIDAIVAHALEEGVLHLPAPHIVVDETYLYALPRFVDEGVGNEPSKLVVVEDEDVYMDMVLGPADLVE